MSKQLALHFATNDHVKKNGIFFVPFSKLKILEGFNDREDYGDVRELAESLYHSGPKVPLKGYKDGDQYVVIVGHRRFRAAELIKKEYKKNIIFPMQMYPPGVQKKDMLLDTLLTNSGKDLTPLEKASTVSKLVEERVSTKEIAKSLGGVSEVYVKNLARLWTVPDEIKKMIRNNTVSATLVMGYLKAKNINFEELIQELKKQAGSDDQEGGKAKSRKKKQAKVTAKNAPKTKENSLGDFKKFRKWTIAYQEDKKKNPVDSSKQDFFELICQIVDNEITYDKIVSFFTNK